MKKVIGKISAMFIAFSMMSANVLSVSASNNYVRGSVGTFSASTWVCENHSNETVQLYSAGISGRFENVYTGAGGTATGMFSYDWNYGEVNESYTEAVYDVVMTSGLDQGYRYQFTYYNDNHIKVLHNFYNPNL